MTFKKCFKNLSAEIDFLNVSNKPSDWFSLILLKKINDRELQKQELNMFINVTLASVIKVSALPK